MTSYIRVLEERGIELYGSPIKETFAHVSDEDFFAAISADIDDYDFHSYLPRYLASNVLILGRILTFRRERRILSKYEAVCGCVKTYLSRFVIFLNGRCVYGSAEKDLICTRRP